jgi:hypothetical protein
MDSLKMKLDTIRALVASLDPSTEAGDRTLETVQTLDKIAETAQSAQRQAVPAAYAAGHTWEAIGQQMRMTRQAAHRRFSGFVSEYAVGNR